MLNENSQVVVTGSLAFDHITDFPGRFSDNIMPDKIHILNLSFTLKTLKKQFGGTAGNIAYNSSLLKIKPTLLAVAGSDFQPYRDHLERVGVDTSGLLIRSDLFTSNFFVITDLNDNQIGGFYPGPLDQKKLLKISSLSFKPSLVVISPNNPAQMVSFSRECRRLRLPFIFDPGQQTIRFNPADLINASKGAKVVIGNDYEIELILRKTNLSKSDFLRSTEAIITTKGASGSLIESREGTWNIPAAKPRKVIDPTGAGDAYRAGLVKGLLSGWSWEKTGRVASLSAVYAVEKYGTQEHAYSMQDFRARFKKSFGLPL